LISWCGAAGYSRGTETAVVEADPRSPAAGSTGAPLPIACRSSAARGSAGLRSGLPLTAAITATNVDDSTTFGAVPEDVPPIRMPSTTLARRGTRGSRGSRRMVVTQSGTMPARSPSSPGGGRGGPAAPRCPPSAWPPAAPPVASHSCPASPQHPGQKRTPARSRPPALPPGAFGRLPHVATWRTRHALNPWQVDGIGSPGWRP